MGKVLTKIILKTSTGLSGFVSTHGDKIEKVESKAVDITSRAVDYVKTNTPEDLKGKLSPYLGRVRKASIWGYRGIRDGLKS